MSKKTRGNGEGSIYYNQSKELWCSQYIVGIGESGKLKRKTMYGKTRKEVKDKLEQLITQLRNEKYIDKSNITVGELGQRIVDEGFELNYLNEGSYLRKKEILKKIKQSEIGSIAVQKVTNEIIIKFLKFLTQYSQSMIKKEYGLLKNIFERAVAENILLKNPMVYTPQLKMPKSKKQTKKVKALTIDEQKKFVQALKETDCKYKDQMLLMLYTGLRMGEINALSKENINIKRKEIEVKRTVTRDKDDKPKLGNTTKTYAGKRKIKCENEYIMQILTNRMQQESGELLFTEKSGQIVKTSNVNQEFKRICKQQVITKQPDQTNQHMLRHTYATRCIESGMRAEVLQKILGHTDIKTTINTYCDIFAEYEKSSIDQVNKYLKEKGLLL